ncbi:hypothetical protein P280DRAFT_262875 [Massarina eburnea CBS 473.64]|uniref:Galactose oxidase n=1 Tax=Massarina eburnea CBS 473.64 TaxID=1395130 RepID=A0A6A6S4U7_9PLEO|nr:hypothetical protein P280DRAFT_262875 [Massarina eburnea CBS 473.64]
MRRKDRSTVVFLQLLSIWRRPLLWLPIFIASTAAQMPYNPTRIFRNGSLLYVFQPSADSLQSQLGSIDISSNVVASELPYTALHPTLPFLDSKEARPFDAIIGDGGNITVYTGDCELGASGGQIWNFVPEASEKSGNGSWTQQEVAFARDGRHVSEIGPNYLSAGIAFSNVVDSDAMSTDAYFFGGMCPFQDANSTDWQSAGNYSNLMVTVEPSQAHAKSVNYQLDVSSSRGPPIPEAGFSLSGLTPTVSNRSDGIQIQQQDFVLIAGHTSSAFINTSQVALFSLPQQSWTFIPVSQPDTSRSDLAIRADITTIEPRSGHSAVLTPDGQQIVVFGGWIGDINTPAYPQLAVLNIGDGYGGSGAWQWTVPKTSGSGLSTGSGIYGHGAVMLPGGVMMVMGGYSISSPSSRWRRASNTNSKTYFLNVTSNSWISDYTLPSSASTPTNSGLLSTPTQKAGLGVGLGIGMAALIGLIGFYVWYTKKLKRQREAREKQLNELSLDAHRFTLGAMLPGIGNQGGQTDYFGHSNNSHFYPTAGQQNQGWRRTDSNDAERTGLLVEIPSPTRGLRRSLGGKPNQPISHYDERRARGSGHIHPIDELDEEQEEGATSNKTLLASQPEMAQLPANRGGSIFDNAPVLDPFTESHRQGEDQRNTFHSASTSPVRENPPNSRNSANYRLATAVHLPHQSSPGPDGRASPTRSSERTGSDLSEHSARSNLTSPSANGSLGRNASVRSAAILNNASHSNPFKTPDASPTDSSDQGGSGWQTPADPRTKSMTSVRSSGRSNAVNADVDSSATARSFAALQAEGEALLGGNPERERARPTTSSTFDGSNGHSNNSPGSVSRAGTVTAATSLTEGLARAAFGRERRKSWLGSVRRALSRSATSADRRRTMTAAALPFESYKDDPSPVDDSPSLDNRNSFPASSPPRRAASDASFWRSRRGKQDWLEEELDPSDPRVKWRRTSGDDWGAPEDFVLAEKERRRREWRERGNMLINLTDDDRLPTPRTPIQPEDLGQPFAQDRPSTPADEDDWDVEAAVERRVVQVMFTVPRSKLRVVNADVERSSILSLPRENSHDSAETTGSPSNGTPSRVKDLAGKFEQLSSPRATPRASPRPSPSPSIKSIKIRAKQSSPSLATPRKSSTHSMAGKGKAKAIDEL